MRLRGDMQMRWDDESFDRLTTAMIQCCREVAGHEQVERWIAEGFWFLSWFPQHWTSHDSWQPRTPGDAIEVGTGLLADLAWWFFVGQAPRLNLR
jgi:hypothetical protein